MMSPPITLSDMLYALEAALLALEDDVLCAPQTRMVALLPRRRRSVLMLRRHVGGLGRMRLQVRVPHQHFDELIAAEFRLARMVDVLLSAAPCASTLHHDLEDLRAEVGEVALSLRLIAQYQH